MARVSLKFLDQVASLLKNIALCVNILSKPSYITCFKRLDQIDHLLPQISDSLDHRRGGELDNNNRHSINIIL